MQPGAVILGAGPAGLSAAWKLSEAGVKVTVVESDSQVGGQSQTLRRDGYLFDLGPHRFHTDNTAVLADIERLMGRMPEKPRRTRVHFLGSYYDYPLSAGNLLSSLSPWLGFVCFADFLATWLRNRVRPAADDSFEAWVVNRFGRRLYDVYFGPYTAKVWGEDPRKLSASWAAQRIAVVDLWDLILRILNLRRGYNGYQHSPYKPDFWYPRDGVGFIYERMAEEIEKNGGSIRLNSSVVEVRHADERVNSVVVESGGRREEIAADFFVSTIPITSLVASLTPRPPADVLATASQLRYRSMVYLCLMIDRESVSDDHWIYFPGAELIFNRVSEMRNFTPDAAAPGKTSLTIEISCDPGDAIWNASDDELYRRSIDGLVSVGLIQERDVIGHFFVRKGYAYPTYDLDFQVNLGLLAYHLADLKNLISAGRQALFRYINQDHAIEMGLCAAEEIIRQEPGTRVGRVGSEQVYFG
jgi:protoporphyrinogen oxidase